MHKRAKGNIGENIACDFIEDRGFVIIERNYLRKWGEIDIVAKKKGVLHFFEVKSVIGNYSRQTKGHKPEDNVDGWKIKHLRRIIETYLSEKVKALDIEFQFHVICVYLNIDMQANHVEILENIIL